MTTATKPKFRITIEHDDIAENPSEHDGSWTPYSFGRSHVNYKDPDDFFNITSDPEIAKSNGYKASLSWEPNNIGLRKKLTSGTAFKLSYFEHGLCKWSLHNEGPYCRWDSVEFAGLLLWEHNYDHMGAKTYEDRQKNARSFLEEYTSWCNGECYFYRVEKLVDGEYEEEDDMGNIIGTEYLDTRIKEVVKEITDCYPDAEIEYTGGFAFLIDT